MKTFKQFDFYMQLLLIPCGIVFGFLLEGPAILTPYFVVGGWQVMSSIVHAMVEGYYPVRDRRAYAITLMIVVVLFPISIIGFLLQYLICLLIVSPFLAIWYFTICYREIRLIEDRELSQLK